MPDLAQPVRVAAQMAMDIAAAAIAGLLLNGLWLGANAATSVLAKLRVWLIAAAALLLAATLTELLALTAVMSDATTFAALRAALPDVASTEAGAALVHTIWAALALLVLSLIPFVLRSKYGLFAGLAFTCVVLASRTSLGHASSDGPWSLREAVQFIHLASVAVWGGGVMIAGLLVIPRITAADAVQTLALGRRLSRTVTVALPCVLLSGIYNSWRGLGGSLAPLPHTQWGQLLLSKTLLVCIALALGARARLMLHRTPDANTSTDDANILRRWLRMEAFVMLAILILSGWLANAPPADMASVQEHGTHPPSSSSIHRVAVLTGLC